MRIIGLDVSRGRASVCLLTEKPDSARDWFRSNRCEILDYDTTQAGLDELLKLEPDLAIMEPTGVHYAKFWANHFNRLNIPILWVGHAALKSHRVTLKLPCKNDYADAFALAHYGFERLGDQDYFLSFSTFGIAAELREICLQIRHLERLTVPLKNRIRQNLSHEWPEVARVRSEGPLWKFIAGRRVHPRSQKGYETKLSRTAGSGISDFTKFEAGQLCNYEDHIMELEASLIALSHRAEFHRYQAVFRQFGFGPRIAALILSHIYPFENFLGPDGREIIEHVKGRNGKYNKRYRSKSSFKLMLGFGLVEDSSGKSESWIPGGSNLCRTAIWQYCFTKIEVADRRPQTKYGKELGEYCDQLKALRLPIKLTRCRIGRKTVELLYQALLYALV